MYLKILLKQKTNFLKYFLHWQIAWGNQPIFLAANVLITLKLTYFPYLLNLLDTLEVIHLYVCYFILFPTIFKWTLNFSSFHLNFKTLCFASFTRISGIIKDWGKNVGCIMCAVMAFCILRVG